MDVVMVVANQTLTDDRVIDAILARAADSPCAVRIVVPATPLSQQEVALTHSEHLTHAFGESGATALARWRLRVALQRLQDAGIDATGDVGDAHPLKAVAEAMAQVTPVELMVSTLPGRRSRWLEERLPQRLQQRYGLPVTHLMAQADGPVHIGTRRLAARVLRRSGQI